MKSFNSVVYALALANSGLSHPGANSAASMKLENKRLAVTVTEAGVLSEMRYDPAGAGRFDESLNVFDSLEASEGFALRFGGYGFFSSTNQDEEIVRGVLCSCEHPVDARLGVKWIFGSPRLLMSHAFYLDADEAKLDVVSTVRYCAPQNAATGCMMIRSFNPYADRANRVVKTVTEPDGGRSLHVVVPECGVAVCLTGQAGAQVGMLTDQRHDDIPESFWVSGRAVDKLGAHRSGLQCLVSQQGYEASFQYRYVLQPAALN